jgi:hypothetical protein
MVVARRTPPIDILRGLARDEAAVLPEIFAGAGAAAAVLSMNDSRSDATRLQDEPRHGIRKRAGADSGLPYRPRFDVARLEFRHPTIRCAPLVAG